MHHGPMLGLQSLQGFKKDKNHELEAIASRLESITIDFPIAKEFSLQLSWRPLLQRKNPEDFACRQEMDMELALGEWNTAPEPAGMAKGEKSFPVCHRGPLGTPRRETSVLKINSKSELMPSFGCLEIPKCMVVFKGRLPQAVLGI